MVYGSCNNYDISHSLSDYPHGGPTSIQIGQQLSTNHVDYLSQAPSWLLEIGSNNHVAPYLSTIGTIEPYYGNDYLHVGNGKGLPILHTGSPKLYSLNKTVSLNRIVHTPQYTIFSLFNNFFMIITLSLNFMINFLP